MFAHSAFIVFGILRVKTAKVGNVFILINAPSLINVAFHISWDQMKNDTKYGSETLKFGVFVHIFVSRMSYEPRHEKT